jgi:hypothetical protein
MSVTIVTTQCDTCRFQSMMWFRAWKLHQNVLTLSWERSRTCFIGTCRPRNTAMVKHLDSSRYITYFHWHIGFAENMIKVECEVAKWCMFTILAFASELCSSHNCITGHLSQHSLYSRMMESMGAHTLTVLPYHFSSSCKHYVMVTVLLGVGLFQI